MPPHTLLTLPLEIRHIIFDYTYGVEPVSYPLGSRTLSAVDRGAPPRGLLNACHQLQDEVRTHYYSLVTFRFFEALNIHRTSDPITLLGPRALAAIRQARKFELILLNPKFCSAPYQAQKVEMGDVRSRDHFSCRVARFVKVMVAEARMLTKVYITLQGWEIPEPGFDLSPLQQLKGKADLEVGEIVASDEVDQELRANLRETLKKLI